VLVLVIECLNSLSISVIVKELNKTQVNLKIRFLNSDMAAFVPNRRAEQLGMLKSKDDNGPGQVPIRLHQSSVLL
jgi:hypothetical protein